MKIYLYLHFCVILESFLAEFILSQETLDQVVVPKIIPEDINNEGLLLDYYGDLEKSGIVIRKNKQSDNKTIYAQEIDWDKIHKTIQDSIDASMNSNDRDSQNLKANSSDGNLTISINQGQINNTLNHTHWPSQSTSNDQNYMHFDKFNQFHFQTLQEYFGMNQSHVMLQVYGRWEAQHTNQTNSNNQKSNNSTIQKPNTPKSIKNSVTSDELDQHISSGDSSLSVTLMTYLEAQSNVTIKFLNQPNRVLLHQAQAQFILRLFDGPYIDNWLQLNITIDNEQISELLDISGEFLIFNYQKAIVGQGEYFDLGGRRQCMANMTIHKSQQFINVNVDKNTCFQHKLSAVFSIERNEEELMYIAINMQIYSGIGMMITLLYIIIIENQIRSCQRNHNIAANMSHYSMEWQCGWTFTLIVVHLLLMSAYPSLIIFIFPLFMLLFIAHFFFQVRLLMLIWQYGNTNNNYDFAGSYYTEMVKLFSKFYFITFVFFIIMIKIMILENLYFFIIFGPTWFPQILWNFGKRYRKSPSFSFCVISTMMHIFFPVYVRYFDGNFLYFKPHPDIVHKIFTAQACCLLILSMQKFFGSRFCFPRRFRKNICNRRKVYEYKVKFEDEMNSSQNRNNNSLERQNEYSSLESTVIHENQDECVICMNNLRTDVENNILEEYMKTPCNHKFHEQCLKQWAGIRSECPTCRRTLPPLEIIEQEDDY